MQFTKNIQHDDPDTQVIRDQCNQAVCDYSWQMIFVDSDAEFDALWDEMTTTLEGNGFADLCAFDTEKHTIELEAKNQYK